jgi:hypothetical protein
MSIVLFDGVTRKIFLSFRRSIKEGLSLHYTFFLLRSVDLLFVIIINRLFIC